MSVMHQTDHSILEKSNIRNLKEHGVDIRLVGGANNGECFLIECKGKSYAKSSKTINKECWLTALGQLITRMNVSRTIKSGKTKGNLNYAYKYGLGLYWIAAKTALKRIPKEIAHTLNLHIFSVNDDGIVKHFTWKDFSVTHLDKDFE